MRLSTVVMAILKFSMAKELNRFPIGYPIALECQGESNDHYAGHELHLTPMSYSNHSTPYLHHDGDFLSATYMLDSTGFVVYTDGRVDPKARKTLCLRKQKKKVLDIYGPRQAVECEEEDKKKMCGGKGFCLIKDPDTPIQEHYCVCDHGFRGIRCEKDVPTKQILVYFYWITVPVAAIILSCGYYSSRNRQRYRAPITKRSRFVDILNIPTIDTNGNRIAEELDVTTEAARPQSTPSVAPTTTSTRRHSTF